MRRSSPLIAATLAALACSAAPASAATPFTVGQGAGAHIAVDADGRAHIAWGIPRRGDTPAKVGYCRIAKGASACEIRVDLDYPPAPGVVAENDPTDVTVFAPGTVAAKLVIMSSCRNCHTGGPNDHLFYWESTTSGSQIASPPLWFGQTLTPAGIGPNGHWFDSPSFFFLSPGDGNHAQAYPSDPTLDVPDVVGPSFVQSPSVAPLPGSHKIVYAASNGSAIQYAVEINPLLNRISAGDPFNWDKQKGLIAAEGANVETQLHGGPSGVYMTYRHAVPGDERVAMRRFNDVNDSFSLPTNIQGDDPIDNSTESPDAEQDASGRIHVVWRSLHGGGRLRYTRSEVTGGNFSAAANVAQAEAFVDPEVGASPDGSGWAVWGSGGDSPVRAVRLEPYAEPAAAAPPPPAPRSALPSRRPSPRRRRSARRGPRPRRSAARRSGSRSRAPASSAGRSSGSG